MVDVEQQIKAWADATAAPTGESVAAADVIEGRVIPTNVVAIGPRPVRGRWLLAAAAVVVAALAVGLALRADDGPEHLRADDPAATTTTPDGPTTTSVSVPAGAVTFEVLGQGGDADATIGRLAAAQTPSELAGLWADSMRGIPLPDVDFAKQVVVSMTIGESACPPTLSGFSRDGTSIEPRFVRGRGSCEQPLVAQTYVVALDWSSLGDHFLFVLPINVDGDDQQETLEVTRRGAGQTSEGEAPDAGVTASLEVSATSIASGHGESGTLTVVNDTGAPIEGTSCGPYFAAYLVGEAYTQEVVRPACAMTFTIAEDTSTYPIEILGIVSACTPADVRPAGDPPCELDGSMPGLPPGEYQLHLDDPQGLVPAIDPIPITIT